MYTESIKFIFNDSDYIEYDVKTDCFCFVGVIANKTNSFWISKQINDTIERLHFIKECIPFTKTNLINLSKNDDIDSPYEEKLKDKCSWCDTGFFNDYEKTKCGHCDFDNIIDSLFPVTN